MTNNSVAIVEDNHDIRQALEQIIESSNDFTLAGSCVTGEEAILKLPILNPKVVLMDIGLGDGMNGIEVVRELKAGNPEILFMMCTIYEEDEKIFEACVPVPAGISEKNTACQTAGRYYRIDPGWSAHEQPDCQQSSSCFSK